MSEIRAYMSVMIRLRLHGAIRRLLSKPHNAYIMSDVIRQKSPVLFFYNRTKKWLVNITRGETLHTHIGMLRHSDAIGCRYGSRLTTNKSKYVYLLRPTMYDYIMKIQHGTQIVYPKELGYIVARAGIGGGQKILEIGTGSGSLTSFVANVVRPRGHVYSFDVDASFMKIAQKNIDRAGVSKIVSLHNLDIKGLDAESDEMPVSEADVALVDLGDPWEVVPHVRRMLKASGCILAVCPTMNQLERLAESLVKNEFTDIESTEQILRNIEARTGKTRHSFQGIGHTTYLCFARKAYFGSRSSKETAKDSSNGAPGNTASTAKGAQAVKKPFARKVASVKSDARPSKTDARAKRKAPAKKTSAKKTPARKKSVSAKATTAAKKRGAKKT